MQTILVYMRLVSKMTNFIIAIVTVTLCTPIERKRKKLHKLLVSKGNVTIIIIELSKTV